jgi:hypothetical protein
MNRYLRLLYSIAFLFIAAGIGFFSCTSSKQSQSKTPEIVTGKVIVKEIAGVKFHTYMAISMASHIIETKNCLILQDTVLLGPHNLELRQYIESLGKPLDRIIVSHYCDHHWIGLDMFADVPVYANSATIKYIQKNGDQILKTWKKRKGDRLFPYKKVVVPQQVVIPGYEQIDGVLFRYVIPKPPLFKGKPYGEPVLYLEFPDQRAIIHHHLAYVGGHFTPAVIPDRIERLKMLKEKNYTWVMAGHGIPMGPEFFDKAIGYYETVQKIIQDSPDAQTAKEKIINAYPAYETSFVLDKLLPQHYENQ